MNFRGWVNFSAWQFWVRKWHFCVFSGSSHGRRYGLFSSNYNFPCRVVLFFMVYGHVHPFGHRLPKGMMPHVLTTCTSFRYIMLHHVMSRMLRHKYLPLPHWALAPDGADVPCPDHLHILPLHHITLCHVPLPPSPIWAPPSCPM